MACVAAQRFVSWKTILIYFVVFLFDHIDIFPHSFELKKMRIEFLRISVKISARELRSETISCTFWMMSVPKQLTLKLKSAISVAWFLKSKYNKSGQTNTKYCQKVLNMVYKKANMHFFVKKIYKNTWEATRAIPKLKKTMCSYMLFKID